MADFDGVDDEVDMGVENEEVDGENIPALLLDVGAEDTLEGTAFWTFAWGVFHGVWVSAGGGGGGGGACCFAARSS